MMQQRPRASLEARPALQNQPHPDPGPRLPSEPGIVNQQPLPFLLQLLLPLLLHAFLVTAAAGPVDDGDCSRHLPLDTPRPPYTRPISTAEASAQALFDQGMVLSFAFNHDEAARSFAAALEADPACVSCALGLALCLSPNINRPVISDDALQRAQTAARAAEASPALGQASEVERAWVRAVGLRFPPERSAADADGGVSYDEAYRDALREMALAFPDDADLPAFFAEAAMTTMPWAYYDPTTNQPKPLTEEALAALQQTLAANPAHPLALHLLIHAVEPSRHPELALPAAEALARLPAGIGYGHLVHMPGHIFVRLGMYHRASEANAAAIALDREYFAACDIQPEEGNYNAYYRMLYFAHKHSFLLFSASMEGRRALATQTAAQLQGECALDTVARVLGGSFISYTAWPWLLAALRFGEWAAVLAATDAAAAPSAPPLLPYTECMRRFVRGYALAATGACAAAAGEASAFAALAANETTRAEPLFLVTAGQMFDVAGAVLGARMAEGGCLEGGVERGGVSLRGGADDGRSRNSSRAAVEWARAAALVDAFPYMEPPMWPTNVRACWGQALLDAGRYGEAVGVYEADLTKWPGNGWSLKGLQLALEGQGRQAEVWVVERAFEVAWRNADVELGGRSCF